jgi:hypothetical protein
MKTLFTILAFAFLHLTAQAGQEFDKLKQDVEIYTTVQAVSPNELIKYSDSQGSLVRAILNTERIQRVVAEGLKDDVDNLQLHLITIKYIQINGNYMGALHKFRGAYDLEYLDSLEVLHELARYPHRRMNAQLEKIKDQPKKTELEKFLQAGKIDLPKILSDGLEILIAKNLFSADYVTLAEERLKKLRAESSKP